MDITDLIFDYLYLVRIGGTISPPSLDFGFTMDLIYFCPAFDLGGMSE